MIDLVVPRGGFEPPTRGFSIQWLLPNSNALNVNGAKTGRNGIKGLQIACKPNARAKAAFQLRAIKAVLGEVG